MRSKGLGGIIYLVRGEISRARISSKGKDHLTEIKNYSQFWHNKLQLRNVFKQSNIPNMQKSVVSGILCCLVIFACSKQEAIVKQDADPSIPRGYTKYFIAKGQHYSDQSAQVFLNAPSIKCDVIFDSSAIYQNKEVNNQFDVNKLIGFSDCGAGHHENSARLGWNWTGTQVMIYAYSYSGTQRIILPIDSVKIGKAFSCSVEAIEGNYHFAVGEKKVTIQRFCTGYSGSFYKLFPYFGGDETAPHDIRIYIKEK